MITYYRLNRLIFYSISPFLLWLSIFSDYLSISLSLFFYLYFFFLFTRLFLVGLNRCLLGLKWWFESTGFQRWVESVAWIGVGFKGGLNQWLESAWVSKVVWIGWVSEVCWLGFNSSIEVESVAGFQRWVESAWVAELVVGFWISFGGWSLFESVRVVEPWRSNWWLRFAWVSVVEFCILNWCGFCCCGLNWWP